MASIDLQLNEQEVAVLRSALAVYATRVEGYAAASPLPTSRNVWLAVARETGDLMRKLTDAELRSE